ncbi:COPS8 family protein [Megaselia abdita]
MVNNEELKIENFEEIMKRLEDDEMDGERIDENLYTQLLAGYLFEMNFLNAQFLYKRIPSNLKTEEHIKLFEVLQAVQKTNAEAFTIIKSSEWSPCIKGLMDKMQERVLKEILDLIATAYTSIYENRFIEMTCCAPEDVENLCKTLDWDIEVYNNQKLITPKQKTTQTTTTTSEEQLGILTSFVSHLEV